MIPRVVLTLCLLPLLAGAASPEAGSLLPGMETVSEHHSPTHGRGFELTFERLPPEPSLTRFNREEARAFMAAMEAAFQVARSGPLHPAGLPAGALTTGLLFEPPANARPSGLERRMRADYEEIYGPSSVLLPSSLEGSRWFQALKLSPRYMDEGVREAALELLSSPAVAYSMALSMMLYMTAWAAPEPVFSKALATAVTLGLLMTYSAAELYTVGLACLNLYQEAEAASTPEQLEAVARRFGRTIGGVGLRVLVTVAGAKLARGLPEIPKGGMWARLSPPRFVLSGGGSARGRFTVRAGTRAQVSVANGTVLLMGVSANTAASAVSATMAVSRTTGACREESNKGDAKGHHIATNKNDTSEVRGGPWTPLFETFFKRAGMSLDDPANILYLVGHQGPHPEAYRQQVYDRLSNAASTCRTRDECKLKLIEALDKIAGDICKPGSTLHKLLTKKS